jgi:uncharacterized membrane protein
MRRLYLSARAKLGLALGVSSLASLGLYIVGALQNNDGEFGYLAWNLLLAWMALVAALTLEWMLSRAVWSSWRALFVTGLWLAFLPNTFYMLSDFVHLEDAGNVDLLYDVVLFASFILNGVFLGFLSLVIVHWQLAKRLGPKTVVGCIGLILLLCSFAVYVGRELRWNTWDIVANPSSVLFDVSDKVLNPREHPHILTTTVSFFVLLSSIYGVLWWVTRLGRQQREG